MLLEGLDQGQRGHGYQLWGVVNLKKGVVFKGACVKRNGRVPSIKSWGVKVESQGDFQVKVKGQDQN